MLVTDFNPLPSIPSSIPLGPYVATLPWGMEEIWVAVHTCHLLEQRLSWQQIQGLMLIWQCSLEAEGQHIYPLSKPNFCHEEAQLEHSSHMCPWFPWVWAITKDKKNKNFFISTVCLKSMPWVEDLIIRKTIFTGLKGTRLSVNSQKVTSDVAVILKQQQKKLSFYKLKMPSYRAKAGV